MVNLKNTDFDLNKRIELQLKEEEEEKKEKRRKKKERKNGVTDNIEHGVDSGGVVNPNDPNDEFTKLMGFSNFK